jgi:hypothetical protein
MASRLPGRQRPNQGNNRNQGNDRDGQGNDRDGQGQGQEGQGGWDAATVALYGGIALIVADAYGFLPGASRYVDDLDRLLEVDIDDLDMDAFLEQALAQAQETIEAEVNNRIEQEIEDRGLAEALDRMEGSGRRRTKGRMKGGDLGYINELINSGYTPENSNHMLARQLSANRAIETESPSRVIGGAMSPQGLARFCGQFSPAQRQNVEACRGGKINKKMRNRGQMISKLMREKGIKLGEASRLLKQMGQ